MSTLSWPDHLLTLAEWDELSEDTSRRFELVDGVLQVTPKPTVRHQHVGMLLGAQLEAGKLAEYAEAGIADYWIVDIAERVPIDVFALTGGSYELAGHANGATVAMTSPVPMTLDLDALVR